MCRWHSSYRPSLALRTEDFEAEGRVLLYLGGPAISSCDRPFSKLQTGNVRMKTWTMEKQTWKIEMLHANWKSRHQLHAGHSILSWPPILHVSSQSLSNELNPATCWILVEVALPGFAEKVNSSGLEKQAPSLGAG